MPEYKAPLRDIQFVLNDVLDVQSHYQNVVGGEEASADMVEAIVAECAKFAENELQPLNQVGDKEGCTIKEGDVTTPSGFKEAYTQFVEAGWQSLTGNPEYGGQGLPTGLGVVKNEILGSANWSWAMYPGLTEGAIETVEQHGSDEQKEKYLTNLISGLWTGTMCLTEPQCGSDLAQVKTKAEPQGDGSYGITGTKIFISAGEHDMAENIVHIVLARLPDAPKGTKGISLFIVPKFNVNEDGSVGGRNAVECGSLEHKMGIHGNATCVMNFDGAKGFLIGSENNGLACMFTYMNTARLGTASQGVSAAELSYQGATRYAKERLSMRSLSGTKNPDGVADPIIVHPDVRRMLLTQKAFAEGGRAMLYYSSMYADLYLGGKPGIDRDDAENKLGFLTPILKAFLTEVGYEAADHGVQVFGGHGFIQEWGMEQITRDTRISRLYEGTTGIQALDLVGRKMLLDKFELLKWFCGEINNFSAQFLPWKGHPQQAAMRGMAWKLFRLSAQWRILGMRLGMKAKNNRDAAGAGAVDFLMFSGYVFMGFMWARMALVAHEQLAKGEGDADFLQAKIHTADFYFERLLPRAQMHATGVTASVSSLMQMTEAHFNTEG